jgi:NDP-sugar pyrophosphorylase family protein
MRAIVVASCEAGEGKLVNGVPVGLLSFVDRPFFQHVIENLAGQQVREFELVLSHLPEQCEMALGDGSRWGGRIRYHLARNSEATYQTLRHILGESDERVILVHADRLPVNDLKNAESMQGPAVTWASGNGQWTGWGIFSSEWLKDVCESCDEKSLGEQAMSAAAQSGTLLTAERVLSVESPAEYMASQHNVLENGFPGLLLAGRAASPGIWISRNVSLHPRAQVIAPVYIGENCEVGADVVLGPMAVIGNNCLLDRQSSFVNSVVSSGTYVGEGLELKNSIADKGRLHNLDLGAELLVPDSFILGAVTSRTFHENFRRAVSRFAALTLLAAFWPVLLATYVWIRRIGGSCVRRRVATTPAAFSSSCSYAEIMEFQIPGEELYSQRKDRSPGMKHFLLCFLPGLLAVAAGRVALVGVPPKTRREIDSMPVDWRVLYLGSRAGLVSEFLFFDESARTEDDAYAADAFFAAASSLGFDLRLTLRYFWSVVMMRRRPARPASVLP